MKPLGCYRWAPLLRCTGLGGLTPLANQCFRINLWVSTPRLRINSPPRCPLLRCAAPCLNAPRASKQGPPAIATHVFYCTFGAPAIATHVFLRYFWTPSNSNPRILWYFWNPSDSNPRILQYFWNPSDSNPRILLYFWSPSDSNPRILRYF